MRFLISLLICLLPLILFTPSPIVSLSPPLTPLADPTPDSSFTASISSLWSDDLSFVDRRILLKIKKPDSQSPYSVEEVAEMKKNFLQWMSLNFLPDSPPLTPSQSVDIYWHEFILFTEKYHQWCHKHFGTFIHHFPEDSDEGLSDDGEGNGDGLSMTDEQRQENNERIDSIQSGWEVTRELMKKYWGEDWEASGGEGEGDKGGCGSCHGKKNNKLMGGGCSAGKCSSGKNETKKAGGCGSCSAKKAGCGKCHGKKNTTDENKEDYSYLFPAATPTDTKSSCGSCSGKKNSTTPTNTNNNAGGCGKCHGKKSDNKNSSAGCGKCHGKKESMKGSCANCKSKKQSNDENTAAGCGKCHGKKSEKGSCGKCNAKKEKNMAGCGKCHGKKENSVPAGCGKCHGKKDKKNPAAGCGNCHGKKETSLKGSCGKCHAKKEKNTSAAGCGKCHGKKESSMKGSCGKCKAKKESNDNNNNNNNNNNKAGCGKCSSKKDVVAVL